MALNNLGDIADSGTLLANTTAIVNGAVTASTSVTISATNTNLFVGQTVTGPGIQQANGIVGPTTITAISASGLVLTLSNPATIVNGAVLTFSSSYAPVTTSAVNGAVSASTAVTIAAANANIVAGQLVSGPGITAGTVVSSISTTSLVLSAPFTIADKAVLTFWALSTPNVSVDLAWGNFPMQPNDDRLTTPAYNVGGAGTQAVTISAASKPSTGTIQFTTSAAHGLTVGSIISTGTYVSGGSTVYSATTTFSSAAKDSTLLTQEVTTSGTHYISPGTSVIVSSATPAAYSTTPNGNYVVLGASSKTKFTISTNTVTLTTNNIGSKDATTASSAVLTAATLTYYPFDVKEARIIAVPSTTTFVVASTSGWSGDSTDSGIGAQSSLTGTLALVADANWAVTTKKQSDRLNTGSLTSTLNGLSYTTGTTDTIATSAYYTYPNVIPGKFAVTNATVCADGAGTPNLYIWYSAYNNLTTANTVTVTGMSNPAFNVVGATILAANVNGFLIANPSTTGTVSGATSASTTVTLGTANGAIKVGMTVTGSNVSGTATVVAVLGTVVTLSSAQSLSNSDTLTFRIASGTNLASNGVASAANFGVGSVIVTAVAVDSTTNTTYKYTAQNNFVVGDSVTITGLTNGTFNVSAQSVASANATSFTLTGQSASTAGLTITGQIGKAEYAAASSNVDGGFVSGTYYPQVPSIIGQTATVAADTFKDRGLTGLIPAAANTGAVPTTTPVGSGSTVSKAIRTSGTNAVVVTAVEAISGVVASGSGNSVTRGSGTAVTNVKVGQTIASTTITPARNILTVNYSTGAITFDGAAVGTVTGETLTITGHGFVTGDAVVVASVDSTINGDATVIRIDASNFVLLGSSTTALSATSGTVTGKTAYVHAQSVAAGTQSTTASTAVSYSVWG